MLHKIEKFILKKLSKQPDDIHIGIENLKPYSGSAIRSAMKSLKEKGYFEEESVSIDLSNFSYKLSTQGRFYKEYRFKCFIHDIFIPIIVSIITTLITSFLCG